MSRKRVRLTRAGLICSENGHCTSNTKHTGLLRAILLIKVAYHFSNKHITAKSEISSTVITDTVRVGYLTTRTKNKLTNFNEL